MTKAAIAGTGSYVPATIRTNHDLEKLVDTSHDWIVARSGISERRIAADHEQTSDLACHAARQALAMAAVTPADLDMIIVATVTPDMPFPPTSSILQHKLGANGAAAFDINAVCSGFLYGLSAANGFIQNGTAKTILVVGAEILSRIVNWQDRTTCVLFGDGAGAVVLQRTEKTDRGILSSHLHADGQYGPLLMLPAGGSQQPASHQTVDDRLHYIAMQGNEIFKVAVRCLTEVAFEALAHNNLAPEDIDLFIPHQANMRIIKAVDSRLGLAPEKVFTNVHKYGNTSAASIPIALDEANRMGLLHPGDTLLLDTFGGGLTWGAMVLRW
ncbi:MAG: ketoacyl-ACP synthase III [Deltaproteobacteria bacterium]|nr:ketoacyl-ACP synthase III [Candidatus Anaeroferrophillus wilburensis]MBN2889035.1 ketoacyl-ACP synthase III [Deltaproteobacteria bacterium]